MVAELVEQHGVPGAVVGVVDAEQVFVAGRDRGRAGTAAGQLHDDTVFAAASLTKPVFASGVMSLVDAGPIEAGPPVQRLLADPYVADDPRAASITARMVLSHTTGLPNWRQDRPLSLRWSPGTRWGYRVRAIPYLHEIVERLAGTSLDRYLAMPCSDRSV